MCPLPLTRLLSTDLSMAAITGLLCNPAGVFLLEEIFNILLLALPSPMQSVVPQVQVKRFVLVGCNKINGFIGQSIRNMLAIRPILKLPTQ